jgi:shikimate 5-dehydrogenase
MFIHIVFSSGIICLMELIAKIQNLVSNDLGESENEFISGVVGGNSPSHYSLSPWLWNKYFKKSGIDSSYLPFDIANLDALESFLKLLITSTRLIDLSVTNPYKNNVYQYLQKSELEVEFSASAVDLQSVNHVVRNPDTGKFWALNTDGIGLVSVLKEKISMAGSNILIIGAGETAKSIAYECVKKDANLTIINRTISKANILKDFLTNFAKKDQLIEVIEIDDSLAIGKFDAMIFSVTKGGENILQLADSHPNIPIFDARYGKNLISNNNIIDGKHLLFSQFQVVAKFIETFFPQKKGVSEVTWKKFLDIFL